ncbi:MAG: T9SS type A sorting domain-containing protein [Melioribacteraceae bacterium]
MKKQNMIFKILLIPILLVTFFATVKAQPYLPPLPEPGTAIVDGNISEWDLSVSGPDFFANMYQAWNNGSNKPILSHLFLRYDCENEIMYALVYQVDGSVPLEVDGDHWIAIDGKNSKVVDESNGLPNFAFVDVGYGMNSNHARGFEAKFSLNGIAQPTDITAHANVNVAGTQTSGTSSFEIPLNADCSVLPVELTSFSIIISKNIPKLNWETAIEVNNFGFEIQRTTEIEKWTKVGFVNGHGNSNSPKFYTFLDNSITESGSYSFRLKQIDIDGTSEYSKTININLIVQDMKYELSQNYPNPFNPSTTISYTIPEQTQVDVIVYNVFGEEITRLVNEIKDAGTYSFKFNATNLAAGLYFYTIQTESYSATKKLILLK